MRPDLVQPWKIVVIGCLIEFISSLHNFTLATEFPPFEKLVATSELPDPLVSLAGVKVTSREQWDTTRRPELKALFQHYMYGYLPPKPGRMQFEVTFSDPTFLDGKATLQEHAISFFEPELKRKLFVLTVIPNARSGRQVPVFIGMNFCGNHAVVHNKGVRIPDSWTYPSCAGVEANRSTDKGRGSQLETWNCDLIVERGYALATFYSGDLDPDTPEFTDGILPSFYRPGQTSPGPSDAGTIACWAWGYHRVVDFLLDQKKEEIAPSRIAAVGHSRNGKTTLLAAALDERIGLAIPHQAGCGGTAPSRGKVGESVKQINDRFPHWFCDEFIKFNGEPERLPFDQHCLVALCAPRPVLFSNAIEDTWANPDGQFEVLQAAAPVYHFLKVEGLTADKRPEPGYLINSRLGYFYRLGKHSMTREDWKAFLDFADKQLPGSH